MTSFRRELVDALDAFARRFARRAADAVRSSSPKVQHRGGAGPTGGSFPGQIRAASFVRKGKSHVVMRWQSLGHKFLFFVEGAKKSGSPKRRHRKGAAVGAYRQRPRPVPLVPSEAEVSAVVEAAAVKHLEQRERAEARRAR